MMLRLLLHVVVLLILTVNTFAADDGFATDNRFNGAVIRDIRFEHSTNLTERELMRALPIAVGDRLSSQTLERSVEELSLRKIFERIDVKVDEAVDGVIVRFLLVPITRVGAITFEGVDDLDERRLRGATGIRLGSRFSVGSLQESIEKLQKYLRDRAYFAAIARVAVVDRKGTQDVTLRYELTLGDRANITEVQFEGDSPEVIRQVQLRLTSEYLGNAASREQVRAFAQELRAELRRAGYWQASVRVDDIVHVPPSGARVRLRVVPREPFWVAFEGNSEFTEEELLRPLRLETRTVPLTPGAIAALCEMVEERYHAAGYFFVNVRCGTEVERENGGYVIRVLEGVKYSIETIEVRGVNSFRIGQILGEMKTKPRAVWPLYWSGPGYLVLSQLDADLAAIKAFYERHGFAGSVVTSEFALNEDKQLVLTIDVTEGVRNEVRAVSLVFSETAPAGLAEGVSVDLEPGAVLSGDAIESERRRIEMEIRNLGYPNARVDTKVDEQQGSVKFEAAPGLLVHVGKVRPQGNIFTRDRVLKSAVGVRPGELWKVSEMEKGATSLAATGLFREVAVQPADGALDSPEEDLLIEVDERDTGIFDLGVELDTEDGIHLTGELGQRNLGGRGESLSLLSDVYIKPGDHLLNSGRIRSLYHKPSAFSRDSDLFAEAFAQFDLDTIDEYSFDRYGVIPTYRDTLSEHLTVDLGPMLFRENLYDVAPDVIIGDHDTGGAFYSFLRGQIEIDLRDDSYNPRAGLYSLLSARYASDLFESDLNLFGVTVQQSAYLPLSSRLVWSNNFRGSLIRGFGDTDVVPISQRIFLGGRNSLRGFTRNKVGPRGVEGNIAGGDTSLVVNSELQYDIVEDVVGVLFLDFGQSVLMEESGFTGDSNSFRSLRYSPGVGLRYRTPIGPLSVEYGLALDREFGERLGRLYIGIGNAF